MITPIAEYTALIAVKARISPAPLIAPAQAIAEAVNRALGDARSVITTAIDALPDPAMRMHAHAALGSLDIHMTAIADLDVILEAIGKLPADVDIDYEVARLRSEREGRAADLVRNTAVLVHALADSRADIGEASA